MRLHFLLPAYNEAANIEAQLEKLLKLAAQLKLDALTHVIDDGSTDATVAIVKAVMQKHPTVQLVEHAQNGGPGKAFETGYRHILQMAGDDEVIISMDADNTHSEQTVRMMLARLHEGYELVIASVYAPGGMFIGLPFIRYVLSHGCNFLYRVLFPVNGICEYTGFYRAINTGALRRTYATFAAKNEPLISVFGFGCAAEMVVKFRRIPLFMTEVPMLVRYDLKGGKSKLKIMRTIREHLRVIGHNLFKRHVI